MQLLIAILFVFIFSIFQPCFSASTSRLESIQNTTKDFLLKNITVEPEETVEIDLSQLSSLHIPACTKKLEAGFPGNVKKEQITSVELTCNDSKSWHMFVPIGVQVLTKVVVAKQPIALKQIITENDVELGMSNKYRLYNGCFKNISEVVGMAANKPIIAGAVIVGKQLAQPLLIRRNQPISLSLKKNAILISMEGIAKEDGLLNGTIKVYNPSSKKMLNAVVIGLNKAEIIS